MDHCADECGVSSSRLASVGKGQKVSKEHIALSTYIKDIHRKLRSDAKLHGWDQTWRRHCSDLVTLRKYADCMKGLACTHWHENQLKKDTKAHSRIAWIHTKCQAYFLDGIVTARRQEDAISIKCGWKTDCNVAHIAGKLCLLDVGSCYNPFQQFDDDYIVTAIDIAPSSENVMQCDFLKAKIVEKMVQQDNELFYKQSFHIIVFSLLLDYFPTPDLRLQCCEKAYDLLKYEGILVIISPDAKHVGANAKYMKSWRFHLSQIGFRRIVYEKLQYLHCMVFRKCNNIKVAQRWATLHPDAAVFDQMYIPQDFNS